MQDKRTKTLRNKTQLTSGVERKQSNLHFTNRKWQVGLAL